jgi:hypothetical protein
MDESALKALIGFLNKQIDALHGRDHFWTTCLIVGCAFEVIFICRGYLHERKEWHTARTRGFISFPEKPPIKWLLVEMLGVVLVLAGIGGELRVSIRAGRLETRVRDANGKLNALYNDKASAADERSKKLDNETQQLKIKAEDERLARVKVEAAVAFRQLTPQQKKQLGDDLARFKGLVGVSFWYQGNDAEAQLFGDDMAEALRARGAIVQPPANILSLKASGKYGDPIVGADTGVTIQSTKVGAAPEFALALVKELNEMGFDAKRQTDPPFDKDTTSPLVWVNVDVRPKGPQGEYKLQAEREQKSKQRHK